MFCDQSGIKIKKYLELHPFWLLIKIFQTKNDPPYVFKLNFWYHWKLGNYLNSYFKRLFSDFGKKENV